MTWAVQDLGFSAEGEASAVGTQTGEDAEMQICQTLVGIKFWDRSRAPNLFLRGRDQPIWPAGATCAAQPSCMQSPGPREAASTAWDTFGRSNTTPWVTGQLLLCSQSVVKTPGAELPWGQTGTNRLGSLSPPTPSWVCWHAREQAEHLLAQTPRSCGCSQGMGGMQKLECSADHRSRGRWAWAGRGMCCAPGW